ncbi:MAG: large subunit ribosomal protein L9 [Parcubacteria group bacterium LiPW_72]|nr:MAG: large subunit ribosomal protein L9 [Parcubacteria group bacterium LiPW_72]
MKIILKKNYNGLGKRGETKEVADGFARNFLIFQEIALPATLSNISTITHLVQEEERAKKQTEQKLESFKEKILNLKIILKMQADVKGKLFGAVGKKEIQKALEKKIGIKVPKQKIGLDKSIKETGNYEVVINISEKSKSKINIQVIPSTTP